MHADVERVADHWRTRAAAEEAVADPSPELLHDLGDLAYLLVWSRRQITIAEAAPLVTRSAALLRRAGDEAEALLVEQSQACRLGDLEQVRELLGRIDLVGDLTQRTRARLRMLQAGADEEELAELTRQIQALPVTADSPPLLRRFWAMGHFGPPDMERYEEHVAEALAEPRRVPGRGRTPRGTRRRAGCGGSVGPQLRRTEQPGDGAALPRPGTDHGR